VDQSKIHVINNSEQIDSKVLRYKGHCTCVHERYNWTPPDPLMPITYQSTVTFDMGGTVRQVFEINGIYPLGTEFEMVLAIHEDSKTPKTGH